MLQSWYPGTCPAEGRVVAVLLSCTHCKRDVHGNIAVLSADCCLQLLTVHVAVSPNTVSEVQEMFVASAVHCGRGQLLASSCARGK